jgi:DNA polymerase-3 subunit epsilon
MPVPWYERRFLGLDFETTDKLPEVARIVSAALVVVNGAGQVIKSWYQLVKQAQPIPAEATGIHHVTTEQANAEGIDLSPLLRTIGTSLAWAFPRAVPVVIYNAPYDWTVLYEEICRAGVLEVAMRAHIIDPLLIDRHCDQYRKGSRKLADVAPQYLFDRAETTAKALGWHDARTDALLSCLVARQQAIQFQHLRQFTLPQLHAQQVEWYATWRDGVNAHWKAKGDDKHEDRSWPR